MSKSDIQAWQAALGVRVDGDFGPDTLKTSLALLPVVADMATPFNFNPALIAALKEDEGLRLNAYPDPLSGGDPWTIGYGATGPDIKRGTVWTQAQAEKRLVEMALQHGQELERRAPWIAGLDPVRRNVLHNMAYNLGVDGLLGFKNTLRAVEEGRYQQASAGMLASKWARQVGRRATRLAHEMLTGIVR